jgi:aminopeptidase N
MLELLERAKEKKPLILDSKYIEAYGKILADNSIDEAFKAFSMELPSEGILHQEQSVIYYIETEQVRKFMKKTLAQAHHQALFKIYQKMNNVSLFKIDPQAMGQRSLKNKCLELLALVDSDLYKTLAEKQFTHATNMTDELGALFVMASSHLEASSSALDLFYTKWKSETLVMQKWLSLMASISHDSTYDTVLKLEKNSVYDRTLPNLVRSLLSTFVMSNKVQFNHPTGRGYKLIADRMLELDKLNPQMASRLASGFKDYRKTPDNLQTLMKIELERILATEGLSKNVFEIVSKTLA